jgi:recombinational DNA repair ATPase RecF
MQFIEYIQVKLPAIQKSIGNNWGLHLHYDPLIEMSTYLQRLEECFNKDVAMGYTTIGPQSQDYYFTVSLDDKKRSADSFFSR